jgi:hypothetical protein
MPDRFPYLNEPTETNLNVETQLNIYQAERRHHETIVNRNGIAVQKEILIFNYCEDL